MKKGIIFLFLIFLLTGCSSTKENVSYIIDTDLSECSIIKKTDTHGGFLGDGELFVKLECNSDLKLNEHWKELPLEDTLKEASLLNICDNNGCLDMFERYGIPKELKGYYYFLDRHSESKDKYDSSSINSRVSYNYSLSFYDSDNKIIYYYEIDT